MNIRRIKGILWQELFITLRSGEVFADIFIFPFANIFVFGFISLYLAGDNPLTGKLVLIGMLLWQIIWIVQYSVTLGSLWNVWSRNLTNIFITPIHVGEYILAHTLSGIVKAVVVLSLASVLSYYAFDFNILEIGVLTLLFVFLNFILFAYALGLVLLGLIFRYGTRIQAMAWATVTFVQPLSAAFYPLEVMPIALQYISMLFPATFTFEAARFALFNGGEVAWRLFSFAFLESILYCIVCTGVFFYLYNKSRDTGQFARNET
jgi:ABC-2 type transport system permease protein